METFAITFPADGIINQIKTKSVYVEDTTTLIPCDDHLFVALWDTGADQTGISTRVAKMLNLKPLDQQSHKTAGDPMDVNLYRANIFLSNKFCLKDHLVHNLKGDDKDFDVLIGMDIISRGDFSITNFEGRTVFSFRIPSKGVIDYRKTEAFQNVMQPKHGNGKRKR